MILLAREKNGLMLKIKDDTKEGYTWYYLAPNVMDFAKTLLYESDLDLKFEVKDGKQYITSIKVLSTTNTNSFKPQGGSMDEYKCIRCGTKLKDNTYKTCYNCSMEIRKELSNSPEEKNKQDSIKRQAIGHMTSRSLIALQGQVDVNNINSIIESLYKKYVELVG